MSAEVRDRGRSKLLVLSRRSPLDEWPRITIQRWDDGNAVIMVTDPEGDVVSVTLSSTERIALIDALS